MKNKKWKTISEKPAGDFRIFSMREVVSESPRTGKHHPFILLDGKDWINIIALTPENQIVMVKHTGLELQILNSRSQEELLKKAKNPLKLEFANSKKKLGMWKNPQYLGYVDPNPAFQTNKCHTILVDNCEKVSEQNLDPGEDIEVDVVSETKVNDYIDKGIIRHSLVLSAFRLYDIFKKKLVYHR
ncbi:MAG: ADP-ribose pyrophosphatase [Methanobacteriota archaeon]|nr:MAG: ADP-ribose pyrophosphatase [Euryarchaeota archaeon]